MNIDLEQQLVRTAERLTREFHGVFGAETVERFTRETFETLSGTATVTTFPPLFRDRFTRDRLRALAQADDLTARDRPEVLYVCVHNAGRSRMAAFLASHLSEGQGQRPLRRLRPRGSGQSAGRAGDDRARLDMSSEFPKPLTDEVVRAADAVVTKGCGDSCPTHQGKLYEDWALSDLADASSVEEVRQIRDEIRSRDEVLLVQFGIEVDGITVSSAHSE